MGLQSSPYVCTKAIHLADEMAMGCLENSFNPMQWDHVQLNLPGSEYYDPKMLWVNKVWHDGKIAGEVPTFVDDMRPTGSLEDHS
jgi:hypothetical protein